MSQILPVKHMLRQLLIGALVLVVIVGASTWYVVGKAMQEIVTPLKTLNPTSGGPRAIIIYSPGVSDFHQKITDAFASGLIASGWRVDIDTASSQTLTDLTGYNLLVIGGPIRGGLPSKPVMDYIARVSSLNGIHVYTVLTSMGGGPQGEKYVSEWITTHGGVEVGVLSLSTMSKNTPVDGATDAEQIAFNTAQKIPK